MQKPKQQLLKTTNKTKSNETKTSFRSPFMPSSQKTGRAYLTISVRLEIEEYSWN